MYCDARLWKRCGTAGALRRPPTIDEIADCARPFLSIGNQYGEGWFLCGEMVELLHEDVPNIVCIQPFACLPNHITGKGVIKAAEKGVSAGQYCGGGL